MMINVDHISAINTTALATLAEKEFGDTPLESVEKDFVDFVTHGAGAYEDYSSWRQAWRDFVDFTREEEAEEQQERVVGVIAVTQGQPRALTAENQLALF
ncbi:hypothetical protein [Marinobacter sp.]|uniref:hypothetical protein n=1 Tax=Marinobacter sp. TaxID=50741 RepID=UPI0035698FB5